MIAYSASKDYSVLICSLQNNHKKIIGKIYQIHIKAIEAAL